ncbi:MAG: DUF3597 domain-containing protein [Candidatus Eisenbacteria bacterium]|nr:DUF3597 domain-containing protein [Candidatus Eisenbacteria bacterium]MCC7140974.1 DUF3597 domain-containing protein [Candidatus Eisenbacteria bacterium]
MSLFGKILEKLGLRKPENQSGAGADAASNEYSLPSPNPTPAPMEMPSAPSPIAVVDVVAQLEASAAKHPEKLNWKVSIVDLLKLLGLESSFGARKELALELGCPAEKMADSAQMNIWLHKTVLQKLAANGGNIPADLLD